MWAYEKDLIELQAELVDLRENVEVDITKELQNLRKVCVILTRYLQVALDINCEFPGSTSEKSLSMLEEIKAIE